MENGIFSIENYSRKPLLVIVIVTLALDLHEHITTISLLILS
jgi:hypothetical protein